MEIFPHMKKKQTLIRGHQIEVDPSNFQKNLAKIEALFLASPAGLNLFPEAATSGFPYRHLAELDRVQKPFLAHMQDLAKREERGLVLPVLAKVGEAFVNRQYIIYPDRVAPLHYDKIHLIGLLHEDRFLTPGNEPLFFPWTVGERELRIGVATCYDLRFPELFRNLTLNHRVDMMLLPAMWPVERESHWKILIPARAVENQTPIMAINGVGQCGAIQLCGSSAIYDSKGEMVKKGSSSKEEVIDFQWNPEETDEWRKAFPVLKDSRSDLLKW